MEKSAKHQGLDEKIIKIKNELSIRNANEITKKLKKDLRNAKAALVQLNDVELFDLSAIQVIHSIRKYAEKRYVEIKIESAVSDEIKNLLLHTGFDGFL
jgi:anti-anti-sigma factor